MTDPEGRRAETLEKLTAAFNEHDLDAIMSFFAENAVFEATRGPDPWGRRALGKDEIRAVFEARFEAVPDVSFNDVTLFVAGDRGVTEWTTIGTNPDGARFKMRGCDLWTFSDDGKFLRKDSFLKIVES